MAHELGDDELLSDSLNTRGVARSALGDRDSLADIEESLRLGRALNSFRAGRAYTNLASELAGTYGDVRRADATLREGVEFVERFGSHLQLRWLQGNLVETSFHLGHWAEALELAEHDLANPEPHYMQQLCRTVRAWIRLARDDDAGALDDIELALHEAHQIRDPQALVPALTTHAFWAATAGDRAAADATLDELAVVLADIASTASGLAGAWVVQLAFTMLELAREREIVDRVSAMRPRGARLRSRSRTTTSSRPPICSPPPAPSRGRPTLASGLRAGSRVAASTPKRRHSSRRRSRSIAASERREPCARARRCSLRRAGCRSGGTRPSTRRPRPSRRCRPPRRPGVEAAGGEDARGDGRARAGLADRHERPVAGRSASPSASRRYGMLRLPAM